MHLTGFDGRVAFVTGAAGGVGRAIVAALSHAGARVMATDLPGALAGTDDGRGVVWRPLDVTDAAAVEALMAETEATLGPVELGVTAAGILLTRPVRGTDPEAWRRVMAVNLDGTFNVTRSLALRMAPRRRGAMVAVGSNAAGVPRMGMAAYAASKAGLAMYMRCLGLELAGDGIRCNIVAPGSTLTPMQTGMWAEDGAQGVIAGSLESYRAGIPLRKLARPEDVANAVMFLLSEQAGHVAMADLYVDGGATLKA